LKGFRPERLLGDYRGVLDSLSHRQFFVPDRGVDIGSYYRSARAFEYKYFCFLNSFSVILDGNWLAKMYPHRTREGVGLVGATGSYQTWHPGGDALPAFPWRPMFGLLRRFRFRRLVGEYRERKQLAYRRHHFGPFPNPHIRTNAFLISRDVMLRVNCPP